MVLPQNMMTEWIWTGSLLAWARVWHLRTKKDAQQETREVVRQIDEPLTKLFPEAWKVLKKWKPVMVEDVG
jgi:thymidylate synthase (FAD)